MDARLKTSTKWTPFPQELVAQIEEVMTESYEDYDLGGRFVVEGAIYPEELFLRIGLNKPNQLRQDNLEASVDYVSDSEKNEKAIEKIHMLVDFLGQAWETFLEDEPEISEMPLEWKEERFEKQAVFFKYSSTNSDLEKQADELLELFEKRLVHESPEDEETERELQELLGASSENSDVSDNSTHVH